MNPNTSQHQNAKVTPIRMHPVKIPLQHKAAGQLAQLCMELDRDVNSKPARTISGELKKLISKVESLKDGRYEQLEPEPFTGANLEPVARIVARLEYVCYLLKLVRTIAATDLQDWFRPYCQEIRELRVPSTVGVSQ